MSPRRRLGPLGLRLTAAFVAVALAAVAASQTAVLLVDRNDVSGLAVAQRQQTLSTISRSLAAAYQQRHSWSHADLQPATDLARAAGVGLVLVDRAGKTLLALPSPADAAPRPPAGASPERVERPVLVGAARVGTLRLAFPAGGLTASERHLRGALSSAVGWSTGLAVVVALLVALLVSRALVRPIKRLSAAARALQAGETGARMGPGAGPGELGELGAAFDAMADSLEREDRLRRSLVADVAHELRTPISILQAESESLVDGLSAPTPEALSSLHDETIRLARMVEDLQTLAAAEAAGLHLEHRRLDLSQVVAEAASSLEHRFNDADVAIEQGLSPAEVLGDPHRLFQVVANLLANAVKYTPSGGTVTLSVRTEAGSAVLEVADTGPGIPLDEQPLVFERFFRGRSGRTVAGSGIGLAVVKELVTAHGGTIRLSVAPGGGARFRIELPQAPEAGPGTPQR